MPKHPLTYLCATMALLALAGCDDDNGGSPAAGTPKSTFDGSGAEIEGYFTFKVTQSSGIYADEYYGPVGLTGRVQIYDNGDGSMTIYRPSLAGTNYNYVTLDPDTATQTYQGSVSYIASAGGTHNGEYIDEVWTLNFNGAIANITVTGGVDDDNDNGTPPIATGSMTIDLQVPWTYDDSQESYFYGKQTAYSTDARYIGQTGITEIYDWSPGAYLYYYWDGSYNWSDYLYVEGLWKEGDTLTGGGYYDGSYGSWLDKFGTVSIALNTSGKPASSSATVVDTATGTATSIAHAGYRSEGQLDNWIDDNSYDHDLTVTSITTGGLLWSWFGDVGDTTDDEFYSHGGQHVHTNYLPGSFNGYRDGNAYATVFWDGNYDTYYSSPYWDYDSDSSNAERWSISLTVDANGFFSGGTAQVQYYDFTTGALLSSESMTFTCNAAPVITSTLTANGTQGAAFSYNVTTHHSTDTYAATGLPTGLSIDTGTGAITGTPTVNGTFNVTISATNPAGTDTETLVMTIAP